MLDKDESYAFPWGFHLGDLHKGNEIIPLFTSSNDGGFCLLYDKVSERKVDTLLESLCLELLSTMPAESLIINLFDVGKKKFFHLSPLQYIQLYKNAHNPEMMLGLFEELENIIISRYNDLLCCNRPSIIEHNQKSKLKQTYHVVLMNLEDFPSEEIELRRIKNFVESAFKAGVYVLAFGNRELVQSENKNIQTILQYFKQINVTNGEFAITEEIFEFAELLKDHQFKSLSLEKSDLMQKIMTSVDLESMMDPENIKLEENTRVK